MIPQTERKEQLLAVYHTLLDRYSHQNWWPGDSLFEIMVGAILTQNTAWSNVEKAIASLRQANLLDPGLMLDTAEADLSEMIRSSGYFRLKARRLHNLCSCIQHSGGLEALKRLPTLDLRERLLGVNGVGPETADDMVLYGFLRPVFVIDLYTRRIFSRIGMINGDEKYEQLRVMFQSGIGGDVEIFSEYHALIVIHAKEACRKKPLCEQCCLRKQCAFPKLG